MGKVILFQGDSVTDAGRSRDVSPESNSGFGGGYPGLVAARVLLDHAGEKYTVINRGISGNRVVDLYARWKIDALNLRPDILSILIGINDTWHEKNHQNGVDLKRYRQVYDMLLEWTLEALPAVKLVLMEPFVFNFGAASADWLPEVAERGLIVRELAEKYHALFIPMQKVLDEAAQKYGDPALFLRDGVHPTVAGHQLVADTWLKYAGHLL